MSQQETDTLLLGGFDFDGDDFVTKEKAKINIAQVDYNAKLETDGWFHDHKKTVDELMLEQHGPNQIRNAIEHDYFYKRYDKALTLALGFIRVAQTNKQCKVSGTKEMTDIAMHCAAKLNRLDVLEDLLDNKTHVQDTGLFLVRGKFYPIIGKYSEAMEAYVQYQRERKLDYRVWSGMAQVFMLSAARRPAENEMRYHLANLSMQRAIHIFTNSRWNKRIDFVQARFQRDLATLETRLKETQQHGGQADKFVEWMNSSETKDKQQAGGLEEFHWDDIMWIYKDWVLRQDLDLADHDIKAVKDL
ncbi:hypothetical protein EDC96DRAFT_509076 [Choanephora cucurbitarum]|nr:hypothetical protein EDC96DRAFT_509076 [Choanephora cucurbitarum]